MKTDILIIEKQLNPLCELNFSPDRSNFFDPRELMGLTTPQLVAKKDVQERWQLAKISSAEFVRRIDNSLSSYPNIEANDKNKFFFIKSVINTMNDLQSKLIDLKSPQVESAIVRFDGKIDNKTGIFLIEFKLDSIMEYVNTVKCMRAININEKLSLTHLLKFYADKSISPFTQFDLEEYRYIYLPCE